MRTLVSILAQTDALFAPVRLSTATIAQAAAVEERRQLYRRAGLSFASGGSAADRQTASRELAAARQAGYVVTRGRTRLTVRLTPAADHLLRAVTGCYRVDESWPMLELVALFAEHGTNSGCVSEADLIGSPYDALVSTQLVQLEQMAAPLLARDWLRSASDLDGRIGYALTTAGRESLAAGKPDESPHLNAYDGETADFFDAAIAAARAEQAEWQSDPQHVIVPLSAGRWPAHVLCPKCD